MIKASELRIGNWLTLEYLNGKKRNVQIIEIGIKDDFLNFEPIPLTPEILEACGFEREGITSLSLDGFPLYLKIIENSVECWGFHYVGKLIKIPCQHLHQLQNLFFALTGEELRVELPVNAQL